MFFCQKADPKNTGEVRHPLHDLLGEGNCFAERSSLHQLFRLGKCRRRTGMDFGAFHICKPASVATMEAHRRFVNVMSAFGAPYDLHFTAPPLIKYKIDLYSLCQQKRIFKNYKIVWFCSALSNKGEHCPCWQGDFKGERRSPLPGVFRGDEFPFERKNPKKPAVSWHTIFRRKV